MGGRVGRGGLRGGSVSGGSGWEGRCEQRECEGRSGWRGTVRGGLSGE